MMAFLFMEIYMKMIRDSVFSAVLMVQTSYELNPVQTCLMFIVAPIFIASVVGMII